MKGIPQPLRAVWLGNTSKLTLDAGSFSIFESGEFAGQGLLDPIHPGEKRLLSYAGDQAMRVWFAGREEKKTLHHLQIKKGVVIETHLDVAKINYSASNTGDEPRTLLLERPRPANGWSLDNSSKVAESTPTSYRFRVPVAAHSTATLEVHESGPEYTNVTLDAEEDNTAYLLDLVKRVPDALEKLKPVIDAEGALVDLDDRIDKSKEAEEAARATRRATAKT